MKDVVPTGKNISGNINNPPQSIPLLWFHTLLQSGWEFLAVWDRQIAKEHFDSPEESGTLSELILLFQENQEIFKNPENIFREFDRTTRTADHLRASIFSTMESQDRSGMIWLREAVQNSRDAMIATGKSDKAINIDFFQDNREQFVARITDPVGMTPHQVWNYLLPPGSSSKVSKDGGGMFGQGFYSLMIWAREVTVKTSVWDGQVTYINFTPKRNTEGNIDDFDLKVSTVEENGDWKGTTIERVDEASGIMGNIQALIGIQFTDLYVGNVEGVDVMYNGVKRNQELVTYGTKEVPGFGTLSLKQNLDKKERLTSKWLYVSEIHKSYLEMLPDWMANIIHTHGLSLDIPQSIELTKSRNAVADSSDIDKLQPYIFALLSEYIVDGFYKGRNMIEMLPLDYLWVSSYDTSHSHEIQEMANKHNTWELLTPEEIGSLQSSEKIIEFLVLIEATEVNGEKISLKEIKNRSKKWTIDTSDAGSILQGRIHLAKKIGDGLDTITRTTFDLDEISPLNSARKELLNSIEQDIILPIVKKLGIVNYVWQELATKEAGLPFAAIVSRNTWIVSWNVSIFDTFLDYKRNPRSRRTVINILTHELTHLREWDKWGSHETGNHSKAFEYMQREILGTHLRSIVK